MTDASQKAPEALILDMLEWLAKEDRSLEDALEAWRTSCPRLTVWEDVFDRGLAERKLDPARGTVVGITAAGRALLRAEKRR